MKKSMFIAVLYAMLAGTSCTTGSEGPIRDGYFEFKEHEGKHRGFWSPVEYKIEEKTIDSCQYIIIFGVEGRSKNGNFNFSDNRKKSYLLKTW